MRNLEPRIGKLEQRAGVGIELPFLVVDFVSCDDDGKRIPSGELLGVVLGTDLNGEFVARQPDEHEQDFMGRVGEQFCPSGNSGLVVIARRAVL